MTNLVLFQWLVEEMWQRSNKMLQFERDSREIQVFFEKSRRTAWLVNPDTILICETINQRAGIGVIEFGFRETAAELPPFRNIMLDITNGA